MNGNIYPYFNMNYNREKDSDNSEKEYKNKDFNLQNYEKFQPKSTKSLYKNKTLKGAENQVKNLLSLFLQNYEIEKENSEILFDSNKSSKNRDSYVHSLKNKKSIKKVMTQANNRKTNFIRTSSFNISLNNENKSNKILNVAHEGHKNHSQKKKVFFNFRKNSSNQRDHNILLNRNKTKKKNSIKNKNVSFKISKTIKTNKTMQRFNYNLQKTKSLGIDILEKDKTGKKENKDNSLFTNKSSKILYPSLSSGLIKKAKSFYKNDNYLNFKNDNIAINRNNKNNSLSLKSSVRKKKGILKNKKHFKIDNFNDSAHNSLLSDLSDKNKKSIDINSFKDEESFKRENKNNSLIFSSNKKSSSLIQKNLNYSMNPIKSSIDMTELSSKNSRFPSSLFSSSPKTNTPHHAKRSLIFNRNKNSNFKRAETSIINIKKKNDIPKIVKLDTQIKSLKTQLKNSMVLLPEELELSLNDEENPVKRKRNMSFISHQKANVKIINKVKTNQTFGKFKKMNSFISNSNNLNLKKENVSKSNNDLSKIDINSNKEKNKSLKVESNYKVNDNILVPAPEEIKNLEKQQSLNNIKSIKSINESSKNSSYDEISYYSIKRKKPLLHQKYRVLRLKANVYDSLDDEEIEDEEEINVMYIDPNSYFTFIFDSILFVFTNISLLQVPFYLAINQQFCQNRKVTIGYLFNIFIEILNILDLFFGFFRAYHNWEEQLITKNKSIAIKYLTSWFIFDLFSSIPIYSINKHYEPFCKENEKASKYINTILNDMNYLLLSNRLFKVFKVFWHNKAWKYISSKLNDYGSITLYICLFYASLNYTACMYIFIGRNSYPNWIFTAKLDSKPFSDLYICSIYILIMAITTVGYGDITCYSIDERIYQLLILIIGIVAYSLVISFVSNYIKKINEKSVGYEEKKKILDEIKITHTNFPDELYDRILRYLKFKNFHEKKFKNIIFDYLPVGLKNDLISEMYKPIIKNFLFFKNFNNTDFIVRVILSFKPIIAYKNDILVNDGDMVEDIMFVKKGVLSVEIPINVANPQENIEKYLNMSLLTIEKGPNIQKIGNSTIVKGNNQQIIKSIESDYKTNNSLFRQTSSFLNSNTTLKYAPSMNVRLSWLEKERKEKEEREIQRKKNLTYVKIIGIRENEHFGDVLMFLEQRSPLRVRVRSPKCELFFLKKIDAVKISTNYPSIWKSINKKSVFNYEQMKKSIKNIVEIYCQVKKIQSNSEDSSDEFFKDIKRKEKRKKSSKNIDSSRSGLRTIKEEEDIKSNQSYNNKKVIYSKFFKNIEKEEELLITNFTFDSNKIRKFPSAKNLERKKIEFNPTSTKENILIKKSNSSLSSLSKSSDIKLQKKRNSFKNKSNKKILQVNLRKQNSEKKLKFGQKVLDIFNGNYKYYRGKTINKSNENKNVTIISEETEQDGTVDNFQGTIPGRRLSKVSKILSSKIFTKVPSIYNNYKLKNNFDIIEHNEEKHSESETSFNLEINTELNSGEIINSFQEENLLNKKVNINLLPINNPNFNGNSLIDFKNAQIQKLLQSFDEDNKNNDKIKQKQKSLNSHKDNNIINEKSEENYSSNIEADINKFSNKNIIYNFRNSKNNESESESSIPSPVIGSPVYKTGKCVTWTFLSINRDISFEVNSSYENINIISGNKYIQDIYLQKKLKNYLLDEIGSTLNRNYSNNLVTIKKYNSIKFAETKDKFLTSVKLNNKRSTLSENRRNSIKKKKNQNFFKGSLISDSFPKALLSHTSSLNVNEHNNNSLPKTKIEKNKFQTGIGLDLGNTLFTSKIKKRNSVGQEKTTNKVNIINNNINYINNSIIDFQKKIKARKNSSVVNAFIKPRRKKENLLSTINFNIQKTNQNLNNPEEFYSNYFNSLLEGKINPQKNNNKKTAVLFSHYNDPLKIKKKKN